MSKERERKLKSYDDKLNNYLLHVIYFFISNKRTKKSGKK